MKFEEIYDKLSIDNQVNEISIIDEVFYNQWVLFKEQLIKKLESIFYFNEIQIGNVFYWGGKTHQYVFIKNECSSLDCVGYITRTIDVNNNIILEFTSDFL